VPRQDEQDVVNNIWVQVFQKIKGFTKDGKPGAFRRWLYTRTRIGVLEYWADPKRKFDRSCRRGDRIDDVPDSAPRLGGSSGSPPTDSSGNSGGPVPKLGLPRLLEPIRPDWYAFWEHAVKGRSAEAVAKELGIPLHTVETAASRVLKHLREVGEDGVPVRALLLRGLLGSISGEFELRTWTAVWYTAVKGRSAEYVADKLGMRREAVYTARCRVLKRLREVAEALELYGAEGDVVTPDAAVGAQPEGTS
jgi:DNA-directed RNA polymerase specialized sigma24 family protein